MFSGKSYDCLFLENQHNQNKYRWISCDGKYLYELSVNSNPNLYHSEPQCYISWYNLNNYTILSKPCFSFVISIPCALEHKHLTQKHASFVVNPITDIIGYFCQNNSLLYLFTLDGNKMNTSFRIPNGIKFFVTLNYFSTYDSTKNMLLLVSIGNILIYPFSDHFNWSNSNRYWNEIVNPLYVLTWNKIQSILSHFKFNNHFLHLNEFNKSVDNNYMAQSYLDPNSRKHNMFLNDLISKDVYEIISIFTSIYTQINISNHNSKNSTLSLLSNTKTYSNLFFQPKDKYQIPESILLALKNELGFNYFLNQVAPVLLNNLWSFNNEFFNFINFLFGIQKVFVSPDSIYLLSNYSLIKIIVTRSPQTQLENGHWLAIYPEKLILSKLKKIIFDYFLTPVTKKSQTSLYRIHSQVIFDYYTTFNLHHELCQSFYNILYFTHKHFYIDKSSNSIVDYWILLLYMQLDCVNYIRASEQFESNFFTPSRTGNNESNFVNIEILMSIFVQNDKLLVSITSVIDHFYENSSKPYYLLYLTLHKDDLLLINNSINSLLFKIQYVNIDLKNIQIVASISGNDNCNNSELAFWSFSYPQYLLFSNRLNDDNFLMNTIDCVDGIILNININNPLNSPLNTQVSSPLINIHNYFQVLYGRKTLSMCLAKQIPYVCEHIPETYKRDLKVDHSLLYNNTFSHTKASELLNDHSENLIDRKKIDNILFHFNVKCHQIYVLPNSLIVHSCIPRAYENQTRENSHKKKMNEQWMYSDSWKNKISFKCIALFDFTPHTMTKPFTILSRFSFDSNFVILESVIAYLDILMHINSYAYMIIIESLHLLGLVPAYWKPQYAISQNKIKLDRIEMIKIKLSSEKLMWELQLLFGYLSEIICTTKENKGILCVTPNEFCSWIILVIQNLLGFKCVQKSSGIVSSTSTVNSYHIRYYNNFNLLNLGCRYRFELKQLNLCLLKLIHKSHQNSINTSHSYLADSLCYKAYQVYQISKMIWDISRLSEIWDNYPPIYCCEEHMTWSTIVSNLVDYILSISKYFQPAKCLAQCKIRDQLINVGLPLEIIALMEYKKKIMLFRIFHEIDIITFDGSNSKDLTLPNEIKYSTLMRDLTVFHLYQYVLQIYKLEDAESGLLSIQDFVNKFEQFRTLDNFIEIVFSKYRNWNCQLLYVENIKTIYMWLFSILFFVCAVKKKIKLIHRVRKLAAFFLDNKDISLISAAVFYDVSNILIFTNCMDNLWKNFLEKFYVLPHEIVNC